ncbi:hypothetical protein MLD38_009400 [Melastoma candidum]|uniref:Uncharacterized protein n=1 Tax=Melastoma candidum TaxID=119954 RepID=A0ACB9RYR5_9MYRT|nr:hypothetical protein MLD38_009400 [Melastoma candidum]
MALASATPQTQHQRDRVLFFTTEDSLMLKQIQSTHSPDSCEVDVKFVFWLIQEIFHWARPAIGGSSLGPPHRVYNLLDRNLQDELDMLSYTINRTSCEISCKSVAGGDAHATALSIFDLLANYSWEAKAVVALAAFAVNYGEFWLVAQLCPSNSLARDVALLKQLPRILERDDYLQSKFDALTSLINAMMELTKCMIEFKELPPQYISRDAPELLMAIPHIPAATYWIVRSIIACVSQITSLIGRDPEQTAFAAEAWELSSLVHKIGSIHNHLRKQLGICYQIMNEKRNTEAYSKLVRLLESPQVDNTRVLQALIYTKDDRLPLIEGTTKKRVGLDVLRKKYVVLLISDADSPSDELFILEQMFAEAKEAPAMTDSQYGIVWLPMTDRSIPWNEERQRQFESQQSIMPWFSVLHPSVIDPAVIKYIKEVWQFDKKVMLVVLDPQGKVVNPNAIHMIWIWGSLVHPFTRTREEALWKEETWRIELLADSIEPLLFTWMAEGKYICLYGGEDMDWIRRFTKTATAVAQTAGISLEMLYLGRSNPKEKVRRNNDVIAAEKLSHTLPDITLIWFFWVRLESMWHSKVQLGKTVDNDPIMQEVMTMLTFDGTEKGWGVITTGGKEAAKSKGDVMLKGLTEYDSWKGQVSKIGFVAALDDHLHDIRSSHHCNSLILPSAAGNIPETVVCAECGRAMNKYIMYRCCT